MTTLITTANETIATVDSKVMQGTCHTRALYTAHLTMTTDFAPCKVLVIRIRNPENFVESGIRKHFCLWNTESWALESRIQLKESEVPLMIGILIQNPSSTDIESGIQYLQSRIHSVKSKMQDCLQAVLDYHTQGDRLFARIKHIPLNSKFSQ